MNQSCEYSISTASQMRMPNLNCLVWEFIAGTGMVVGKRCPYRGFVQLLHFQSMSLSSGLRTLTISVQ